MPETTPNQPPLSPEVTDILDSMLNKASLEFKATDVLKRAIAVRRYQLEQEDPNSNS